MVTEVIAKLKEVGLSVGAQKTHWTSYPKMMDKSIMVGGMAVLWEEVLEFVGSKVCLDGNARHAIAHRFCSSQQVYGEVEASSEFFMAPQVVEADDGQGPKRQKLRAGVRGWVGERHRREEGRSWMELSQWWRLWHRTGHRWIEKGTVNVLTAVRERMLSWAGHVARMDHKEICAKALRCRGLQWWRWRQLHWKEVGE